MAFTVAYPTSGDVPAPGAVALWLTARGEPFEQPGPNELKLTFLPLRFRITPTALHTHIDVTPTVPLTRLVDLLFDFSVFAGADVRLHGAGSVTRPRLWITLADEQDRLRISQCLRRAEEHGNRDEVVRGLWRVVDVVRDGHDDRWDTTQQRIIERCEVGSRIPLEDARFIDDSAEPGDVISVPIQHSSLHTIAWRWLCEAYPGLAEAEHTLH